MPEYEKLLQDNKLWAAERRNSDPDYFKRLSTQQSPDFLWVGCSDSRVPADKITGTEPGQIFVHRNIANLVVNTDINFLSVLQYAVEVLEVKHIIICGHYGCGGIKAAMTQQHFGIINHWLNNIKDTYRLHRAEIDCFETDEERLNSLTDINVKEQVLNLAKTSIIQKAWKQHRRPHLHGWVYGLNDGIIKPVFEMEAGTPINTIYELEI